MGSRLYRGSNLAALAVGSVGGKERTCVETASGQVIYVVQTCLEVASLIHTVVHSHTNYYIFFMQTIPELA